MPRKRAQGLFANVTHETHERLDATAKATKTNKSRIVRSVLELFPWWRTDKVNVVYSIPREIANNQKQLDCWLDDAKKTTMKKLGF